MKESNSIIELTVMIDYLLNLDRNGLKKIRNKLTHLNEFYDSKAHTEKESTDQKLQLIGSLPFVLLDRTYFPTNEMLVEFAKRNLDVDIVHARKRSRNEIIGTIIAEISNKDQRHLTILTAALHKILGKKEKGEIKNFFLEWDKIIRES
jgi:hypothetical protein